MFFIMKRIFLLSPSYFLLLNFINYQFPIMRVKQMAPLAKKDVIVEPVKKFWRHFL